VTAPVGIVSAGKSVAAVRRTMDICPVDAPLVVGDHTARLVVEVGGTPGPATQPGITPDNPKLGRRASNTRQLITSISGHFWVVW
jgi:hypothetical protein